jgi:hypothetical protein
MTNEISTQQICSMLRMHGSQLSKIINNAHNNFPTCVRVGGVTGTSKIYDKKEVEDWVLGYKEKKAKKKPIKTLINSFIRGNYAPSATKEKYSALAITARQNQPKTQKIHIEACYDKIQWSERYLDWGGN